MLLPNVEQANTGTLGDLVPSDAAALDTEVRSVDLFSFPVLSRTVVVERDRNGLGAGQVADIYLRSVEIGLGRIAGLQSIPFALPVTDDLFQNGSDGAPHAALTYLFFPPEIGPVGRTGLAQRFVDRQLQAPGLQTGVTGAVPARGAQINAITQSLPLVELLTVLLVTVAVGLHFRSLVAPLLNVLTVGLAYVVAVRLVGGIGSGVGIVVPQEVEPVMVALLFGIVTDYVIFFVSRYRAALAAGEDAETAAIGTTAGLAPIILAAALSVAAASASLVVAELGFFRAFGPGLAIAVLIAAAIVMTLVPALMAIAGARLYWPSQVAAEPRSGSGSRISGLRRRLIGLPLKRPALSVLVISLPLVALTVVAFTLSLANTLISGLPTDSEPKQALRLAAKDFPPGAISPTMVLVEQPGIADKPRKLQSLRQQLADRRNVSAAFGPGTVAQDIDLGATLSPTGDAVRYLLVLDVDPLGARAINTVERLDSDLPGMLEKANLDGARASLAGDTALSMETVRKTSSDVSRILPVAAFVVFVILAIFLRALVAPAYLVLTSLLGLGAALGLTVVLFQYVLGYGELTFFVPFAGIILLIAVGSDYNIYLVGRVWSEARSRPLPEAIAVAGERATTAITVAGLVLALSFAALAVVPLRPFRELAFLLASGLLIDAFVIRSFLAPALIALIGERSFWPSKPLRPPAGDERRR